MGWVFSSSYTDLAAAFSGDSLFGFVYGFFFKKLMFAQQLHHKSDMWRHNSYNPGGLCSTC